MPRREGMTMQLGHDHRFSSAACGSTMCRSTEFASFCSRVVLMSITI
jgi:hypothetical protein